MEGTRCEPLILIEGARFYDPEPRGVTPVLVAGTRIVAVGPVDAGLLARAGLDVDRIDGRDGILVPGLIDPHEHLLGGSGEEGFASQTPDVRLDEIVLAGFTTVVGLLGADVVTRTMQGLLARAKALTEQGLSAYLWTGGYQLPPATITGEASLDVQFVQEVIGAGEIALADERSSDPLAHELARLVSDVHVAGRLARKAGLTHFHVGEGEQRLALLRQVLDEHDVDPSSLYPSHVQRSSELLEEAVALVRRGGAADVDLIDRNLHEVWPRWKALGGDRHRLTVSSDAGKTRPGNVLASIRACVNRHGIPLEEVLPLATCNPARVLKLPTKGRIAPGLDADLVLLSADGLEVRELLGLGKRIVCDGVLTAPEPWVEASDRAFEVRGGKAD